MSEVRCNICGLVFDDSQARAHAITPEHDRGKSELANALEEVSKRKYDNENSVISEWREQADLQ